MKKPDKMPNLPEFVLQAYRNNNLVLFVGNGVSRMVGGVSWNEFADKLLKQLCNKELSFGEFELLKAFDPKKKISIAFEISKQSNQKLDFKKALQLDSTKKEDLREIYRILYSTKATLITTNYDALFAEMANTSELPSIKKVEINSSNTGSLSEVQTTRKVCWQVEEFNKENLSIPGNIFYLHGYVEHDDKMILTTSQYFGHYGNDKMGDFLIELFGKYTVLFIGYGLEELEIIEFMFRSKKPRRGTKSSAQKHCLLYPYFDFQKGLLKHLTKYYRSLGEIAIEKFPIDDHDHLRLKDIIEDWCAQLQQKRLPPHFQVVIKQIDEALNE